MGKNLKAQNMYGIKICYFKIFLLATEYYELIFNLHVVIVSFNYQLDIIKNHFGRGS